MSQLVSLSTALCLPIPEIEALIKGQTIAAMPRIFLNPGRQFALYPANSSTIPLSVERYYRLNLFSISENSRIHLDTETVAIKAWARCEFCQVLDDTKALDILSPLTVWTKEGLEEGLGLWQNIFLAYLRVYHLPQPLEVSVNPNSQDKIGKFVGLPRSVTVTDASPVLSNTTFPQRRYQLENRRPPPHPELEELQSAIALLSTTNPKAKQLDAQLKTFLGWSEKSPTTKLYSDLGWISAIASLGNRTKELDTGKSNYQAGTDFENVVRDSLEFLGFTIDYAHKGGAGGLDLFCSKPYPLVGECKAGKKIPNDTAVQLLNLGTLRLKDAEMLKKATKLIIGPGEPTRQLNDVAKLHGMAIMNPETLEKLVKLHSKYPNSVDLFKLKEYLKPGQSDDEVAKYIEKVEQEIKLRSQIVQAVKQLCSDSEFPTVVEIKVQYNAKFATDSKLTYESVKDLTIELSSPLTGYLGREKGNDAEGDRFYFLRDLLLGD